jgi:hypothetical protein
MHAAVGPFGKLNSGEQRQDRAHSIEFILEEGWRFGFAMKTKGNAPVGPWFLGLCEPERNVWDSGTDCIGFRCNIASGPIEFVARHEGVEAAHEVGGPLRPDVARNFKFECWDGGDWGPVIDAGMRDSDCEDKSVRLQRIDGNLAAHLPLGKNLASSVALSPDSPPSSVLIPVGSGVLTQLGPRKE